MADGQSAAELRAGAGLTRSAPAGRRYAAFISYSHADEEFGEWLHRKLETYVVPSPLRGRRYTSGVVGSRLGKIFRDRADLSAAHDLSGEIRKALQQSDVLIVLCSPHAARSKYVAEEIRYFKELGGADRIFAAILDGEPHAAGKPGRSVAEECFPEALVYQLGPDLAISREPETAEPIAADFRAGKDGRENGALKLVAGLLDVGLDELVQREKQAERRRRIRANLIAGVMAVLALGAAGAGAFAWVQRNLATGNAERAEQQTKIAVREQANARQKETEAVAAQTQAEKFANERDAAANEAEVQRLAAEASSAEASAQRDNARNTLGRMFADSAWKALESNNYSLAVRYSLAGLASIPGAADAFRGVLARALFEANDSMVIVGHGNGIDEVMFTSDSARLITVGYDGEARIWDATTGRETIQRRPGFYPFEGSRVGWGPRPSPSRFSADGQRVLTFGELGSLVFNTAKGARSDLVTAPGGGGYTMLSANGAYMAALRDGRLSIADASTLTALPAPQIDGSTILAAFSPDSAMIAALGEGHVVHFLNPRTGAMVADPLPLTRTDISALTFSADSSRLAVSTKTGLQVWRLKSPALATTLDIPSGHKFVMSRDGGIIASSTIDTTSDNVDMGGSRRAGSRDNAVQVWNGDTGVEIATFDAGDKGPVLDDKGLVGDIAISPDGSLVAVGMRSGEISVWSAPSGDRLTRLMGHTSDVYALAFSPDGSRLASGSLDMTARVWTSPRGRETAVLAAERLSGAHISLSPDGRLALAGMENGEVSVWNAATGERLHDLRIIETAETLDNETATFNASSNRIVAGGNGYLAMWDAGTGAQLFATGYSGTVLDAVFLSDDGPVAVLDNNAVRVVRKPNEEPVFQTDAQKGEPRAMAISADGRRLAIAGDLVVEETETATSWSRSSDTFLQVYDTRTWRRLAIAPLSTKDRYGQDPTALKMNATGAIVVLGDSGGQVRVFDVASSRFIAQLDGDDAMTSIALSPDGRTIAGATQTRTLIWDWKSQHGPVSTPKGVYYDAPLSFSPDSSRLFLGGSLSRDGKRFAGLSTTVLDVATGRVLTRYAAPAQPIVQGNHPEQVVAGAILDVSLFMASAPALASLACSRFLGASDYARTFDADEAAANNLIGEVWLGGESPESKDVCAGVAGAAPLRRLSQE